MSTDSLKLGSVAPTNRRGLRAALWVAQGLLAALFLMSGGMKVSAPIEELQAQMPWVSGALGGWVRFIGVAELLGAVGVIAPAAARIQPALTPLAASGLATIMLFAAATHGARGEVGMIVVNMVIGAMALFVAWGRFSAAPVEAR